jgi:hypothetical protein
VNDLTVQALEFFATKLATPGLLPEKELLRLESSGSEWIKHFFPKMFSRSFTFYQNDFWKYVVDLADFRIKDSDAIIQPNIQCHPRGVGKSANSHGAVVYLLARKAKKYILYVCDTVAQAKKHFNVIKNLLEDATLLAEYPHLAPKISKHRNQIVNWSADRLVTADGQVVEFISIEGNARGLNTEEGLRLDLIIFDDIDDEGDKHNLNIVEKKLDVIGSNILGAGHETTDIIFAQNLIHKNSVCSRLKDNTAGILVNRKFVGPYPLCKFYSYTEEKVEGDNTGAKYYRLDDFQPFDPATSRKLVQSLLVKLGPARFETECQQNLNQIADDKDFREYSEIHHVITYSEFYAGCKKLGISLPLPLKIPHNWTIGLGFDSGTTPGHPSAIIPIAKPNEYSALKNLCFTFGEVVLPKYPHDPNIVTEIVSPGRIAQAEKEFLEKWGVAENQVTVRRASHEASAMLNALAIDLPENLKVFYRKWKAQKGSGVPQIQHILEIDYEKPHLFRKYPANHPNAGEPVIGQPRWMMIVPDEQGKLLYSDSGLAVAQPYNDEGLARLRGELPQYSHRNTGQSKIFDDAVDAFRGIAGTMIVLPQGLTDEERLANHLKSVNPDLLPENIAKIENPEKQSLALAAAQIAQFDYKEAQKRATQYDPIAEYLNQIGSGEFTEL